ncbi:MAG: ATP-binding protein [Candidatus Dojkabacteria bacterium]
MNEYFHASNPWWRNSTFDTSIPRQDYTDKLLKNFDQQLIQIITGLRRVGKSTIVRQLIQRLITEKCIDPHRIFWFSAEERIIENIPLSSIINEFRAFFEIESSEQIIVCIDEVQFRPTWVQEIKSLYDIENTKFILTGSSALLLSEHTDLLTGRFLKTVVYPLNFKEFLEFTGKTLDPTNPARNAKRADNYLKTGGMPEYVLRKPENYLQTTVESILFRDLVTSYKIRSPFMLGKMLALFADRVGTRSSSPKLARILEVSKDAVLDYTTYMEMVFLTSRLPIFSSSRNEQIYNADKIYFEDVGVLHTFSRKFNQGAAAENAVVNHLHRNVLQDIRTIIGYWWKDGKEIDFVVHEQGKTHAIEVKQVDYIEDLTTHQLEYALKYVKFDSITIVTRKLEGEVHLKGHQATLVPLYKFLLNEK